MILICPLKLKWAFFEDFLKFAYKIELLKFLEKMSKKEFLRNKTATNHYVEPILISSTFLA